MKRFYFSALLTASLVLGGCSGGISTPKDPAGPTAYLNTSKGRTPIFVEIVDTMPERTKGLMNRTSMDHNRGMLFIFDTLDSKQFWMKNTLIPLDMIFLDKEYKVVHIAKSAQPCKNDPCEVLSSVKPSMFVLEVNAGISNETQLKEGDKVDVVL